MAGEGSRVRLPPSLVGALAIALLVGAITGIAYAALYLLRDQGNILGEAWRILTNPNFMSADRVITILAIAFVLAAGVLTPIAIVETRAVRAFARLEAELRETRPADAVGPYSGEHGEGVVFVAPDGAQLLLLHPQNGVGRPVVVHLAPPPPIPPEDALPHSDERTSPMGS